MGENEKVLPSPSARLPADGHIHCQPHAGATWDVPTQLRPQMAAAPAVATQRERWPS